MWLKKDFNILVHRKSNNKKKSNIYHLSYVCKIHYIYYFHWIDFFFSLLVFFLLKKWHAGGFVKLLGNGHFLFSNNLNVSFYSWIISTSQICSYSNITLYYIHFWPLKGQRCWQHAHMTSNYPSGHWRTIFIRRQNAFHKTMEFRWSNIEYNIEQKWVQS